MVHVKFSVTFETDLRRIVSWVKTAEEYQFDTAWILDSQCLWPDVYSVLALCSTKTAEIRLATGVTNPITRHPAVTANAIMTINELSSGRAVLGIGPGDSAVRTLGLKPANISIFREAIVAIKKLLAGEEVQYDGKTIGFKRAESSIPVYVSALGPKMLQLAGELGDGAIVMAGIAPPLVKYALDHLRKGAERKPDVSDLDIAWWTCCIVTQEREKVLEQIKPWIAAMLNCYARASTPGLTLPPALLQTIEGGYNYSNHLQRRSTIADLIAPEVADMFAIVGDAEYCRERIEALARAGIKKIALPYYLIPNKEEAMKTLAKEVMSYF